MEELEDASHPHGAIWFSTHRSEIVNFVNNDLIPNIQAGKRHLAIKAPVKSGKREIVEFLKVRCKELGMKHSVFYITALNRKDVQSQKAELELYGIDTHCIRGEKECNDAIEAIRLSDCSISCMDECDYGSGARQRMAPLFTEFMDIVPHVFLYFSATIEETLASTIKNRPDFYQTRYTPPPTYRGAKWFLDNKLVFKASPFFEKDDGGNISFTEHAYNVIRESMKPGRNVGVVRVTKIALSLFYPDAIKNDLQKKLNLLVPGAKPWKVRVGDKDNEIKWECEETGNGHVDSKNWQYLIVICQTCTRGTDLKHWHRGLAFWHDSRPAEKSNSNTLAQAVLRISHYGEEGHPIRLYADERLIKYVIDDDFDAYSPSGGKAPTRTKKLESRVDGVLTTTLVSTPASMYGSPPDEDSLDPGTTVPSIIQITKEQFLSIRSGPKALWKWDSLYRCIEDPLRTILKKIDERPVDNDCPGPDTDGYKKKITALVESARANKKLKAWASKRKVTPGKDYYVIYLDEREHRIIVSIYYGSKTATS